MARKQAPRSSSRRITLETLEPRLAMAAVEQLLADLGTALGREWSPLSDAAVVDGVAIYQQRLPTTGAHLWRTDGTGAGTYHIKELPGENSSALDFTSHNGQAFFRLLHNDGSSQLWVSDGTYEGTRKVADVSPEWFTQSNGTLFFEAGGLWKTDGTTLGTVRVRDLDPHPQARGDILEMVDVNGVLFFAANDSSRGYSLWKSDGTAAGTTVVLPGIRARNLRNVGGTLIFTGEVGTSGEALWKSDGTRAGTKVIKDLTAGPESPFEDNMPSAVVGNRLYFVANTVEHGKELWQTDGTEAGTRLVADIAMGSMPSNPRALTVRGSTLLFIADLEGQSHLFKLYTVSGQVVPIPDTAGVLDLEIANNIVFGNRTTAETGTELFKFVGPSLTPSLVKDIAPGAADAAVTDLVSLGKTLVFFANDGVNGGEVWRSNGAETGTRRIINLPESTVDSIEWEGSIIANGKLLFGTSLSSGNPGLWLSDGTATGTVRLSEQTPMTWPSVTGHKAFVQLGRHYYFISSVENGEGRLWRTNLTPERTVQVTPWVLRNITGLAGLAAAGGRVYFFGRGSEGDELWTTNGTAAGTQRLAVLGQNARPNPFLFADQNGILLFSVGQNGATQLWQSNGTIEGTHVFRESIRGNSVQYGLVQANGFTFFSDDQGLWRTDGTNTGTVFIHPQGWTGSVEPAFGTQDGSLLYRVTEYVNDAWQTSLWRLAPGATAGEQLLVVPSTDSIRRFMDVGTGTGFFTQIGNRMELWKTNGTREGTQRVRIMPMPHHDGFNLRTAVIGSDTYFTYYTETTGLEIWRTDGTNAGTHPIEAIVGTGSMRPDSLINLNNRLFFVGDNGRTGREWWSLPLPPKITATGGVVYREGNTPVLLAANALLADADSANFNRARLSISLGTTNVQQTDRLTVATTGTGASRITIIDGYVKYGSYTIGRVSGGIGTTPLIIQFNANATVERVQALLRSIAFHTLGDITTESRRDAIIYLFDINGESEPARVPILVRPT